MSVDNKDGRPVIRKLGTIDCDLVETTPPFAHGYHLGNVMLAGDRACVTGTDINNSDIDFCEHDGRVVINYCWGSQLGVEFLAEAVYDGTLREFLTA